MAYFAVIDCDTAIPLYEKTVEGACSLWELSQKRSLRILYIAIVYRCLTCNAKLTPTLLHSTSTLTKLKSTLHYVRAF